MARIVVRDGCVGCSFCRLSCRFDAIDVLGRAEIDHSKCTMCGRCISYCPVSALVVE